MEQLYFGLQEYNMELRKPTGSILSLCQYLSSGHFLQANFENWESEFRQMAILVWLTIFLQQNGSSESKGFGGFEEVDHKPSTQNLMHLDLLKRQVFC